MGSAKVYVDGVLRATVNTRSSSARNRVVAFQYAFGSQGTHTIRIVDLGTAGHPQITADGFLSTAAS